MNPSPQNAAENHAADMPDPLAEEKSMRLGVGDFADEARPVDPLANAGSGRRLNTGSLVIVAVIIVAFGALWGLRRLTSVTASTGASTDVELTIEKFLKGLKGDDGKTPENPALLTSADNGVLDVLKGTYTQRQVPLTDVQRNPFILDGEITMTSQSPGITEDSGTASARQRTAREDDFKRAASSLHLKTVIMGSAPLANISGKIVRVGEEVVVEAQGVAFKVTKITPDEVVVVGEDAALSVKLEVSLALKRFN